MVRFFTVLLLAAGLGGAVAWYFGLLKDISVFNGTKMVSPEDADQSQLTVPIEKLGDLLYSKVESVKPLVNQERHGADPVVVPGNFQVIEKMDACSQAPGQILFVGQEVPDGTVQVAGLAPLLQSKIYPALVEVGDTTYFTFYKRLNEGDLVGENEMVAIVNPAKAIHGILEKTTKVIAAEAEEASQRQISTEAKRRVGMEERLRASGSGSEKDLGDARLTDTKSYGDWIQKIEAAKLARIDLSQARLILSQHRVKNLLPVKQCIIKSIYKRTGEAVKELEPILQIYAIDRLTAEGLVELQFENRLKLGQKVIIEPTRESSPQRVWRSHKKEITAVAVAYTGSNAAPLAASASEDGTVCLWDEKYAGPIGLLTNAQPVKSLTCSPREAEVHWLLAGLADGSIAIWDLDAIKNSENKPLKILKDKHGDAVTALAFSPDGRYFASGSTDGTICLWDTKSPDSDYYLFPFDAAHGVGSPHSGQVTALHFTPQCTLVSAGRDNTLRVWELHKKGAALDKMGPIAGRSGTIASLGVSRDGSSILFDQGKALQFLSPDGRAVATLQNPTGTIPFQTLAEFSPDASLVLTAGAPDGRLQLWKAPTDGKRGFELRQFVTSEKSECTSAAFFDKNAAGDIPFAVSGAKDGVVYLWSLPTRDDVRTHRIDNVTLTQKNPGVETRQIRIGVEVPNDGRLLPGQPVTIVIE